MLYDARDLTVKLDGDDMDCVAFGGGARALVMLPGVGDGLRTVRGSALPLAFMYRLFAKDYRVYVFSRRRALPAEYSTRDMAADQSAAMDALGIERADVIGVSQGGIIAQRLAIDHPEKVGRLVLAVTSAGPSALLRESLGGWLDMAQRGDYAGLMIDSAERCYSEAYLKKHRASYPIITRVGKPKDFSRFITLVRACFGHDARGELGSIRAATLVLGAERDRVLGPEASRELAAGIAGSELYMYPELSHGAYEEAGDFNRRMLDFLLRQ